MSGSGRDQYVSPPLEVEEEGSSVESSVNTIDFVGSPVTVTKTADGEVEVDIGGPPGDIGIVENNNYFNEEGQGKEIVGTSYQVYATGMMCGTSNYKSGLEWVFCCVGERSAGTGTFYVRIWDYTNGVELAELSWTTTGSVKEWKSVVISSPPSANAIIEVQARVTASSPATKGRLYCAAVKVRESS